MGQVIARSGENWRVDIGAAHAANLDGLAFEGATKRNRPNLKVFKPFSLTFSQPSSHSLQVGSLLYARVSLAHRDMEPELECFDAQTRKSEGFGELKSGLLVRCSLKMCRQCALSRFSSAAQGSPKCPQVTRPQALFTAPSWCTLPLGGSRRREWPGMGGRAGAATGYCSFEMYRGGRP